MEELRADHELPLDGLRAEVHHVLELTPVWLLKLERYMSSTSFFGKMSASLCAGGARETGDGEAMPARPEE